MNCFKLKIMLIKFLSMKFLQYLNKVILKTKPKNEVTADILTQNYS